MGLVGENSEPSDSQGFISFEEVVSPPSAEDEHTPPPRDILPFPPLTKEINPSSSVKPVVTFSEGNDKQDNDVLQGPLKAKGP